MNVIGLKISNWTRIIDHASKEFMLIQNLGLNHVHKIHTSMVVPFVKPEKKLTTTMLLSSSTTAESVETVNIRLSGECVSKSKESNMLQCVLQMLSRDSTVVCKECAEKIQKKVQLVWNVMSKMDFPDTRMLIDGIICVTKCGQTTAGLKI